MKPFPSSSSTICTPPDKNWSEKPVFGCFLVIFGVLGLFWAISGPFQAISNLILGYFWGAEIRLLQLGCFFASLCLLHPFVAAIYFSSQSPVNFRKIVKIQSKTWFLAVFEQFLVYFAVLG